KAFYDESGWRQHFYGGAFFKIWGAYPVYVGLHDYSQSLVHHIALLNDGASLCVFPEGGTTPDGNLRPAKGGTAYLAHETGVAIVPVAFSNNFNISAADFFLRRRHIAVTFGQPMYVARRTAGITPDECKVEAQKVMDQVAVLLGRVSVG
ncbi:MAG: 1-acyl-sn-glycerol-3-phosphate acyltransferase, partial [Patescibacteria group bacterium]|nr:1-acyl-sn-glycerol-3-phosphate acyltransferase [Patescibacteria group bacterium]